MANLIGIEIDAFSVRGAVVKTQFRRAQVMRYIEVPLASFEDAALLDAAPASDGTPPSHASGTATSRAVKELLRQAGAGADTIASLSAADVSLRRIELPIAAAKKVDELLPFEVESLIPFEAEETLLDYQTIEGDASKLRMLVCAAPKDRITERLRVLDEDGLDPVSLIPSAPALAGLTAFIPALANGTQMVLFISFDSTEVCMLQKGRPELARTIPGGIRCLDEVSFGEPTPGTDAERYARELKQTITSYRMQGGAEPERVFVSGALDPTGMTSRWVAQALKREAEDIVLPDVPSANGKGFDALDPALKARFALPLALVGHTLAKGRYIDLRKNEFARKRNVGFIREFAPLLGVAAATVFLAWGFSIYAHYSVLQARREALEAELAQVSETYLGEETHTVADARRLLEQGRAHPDPMPQWTALDALLEVSNAIPEDITHDVQRMQIDLAQDRSEGHFELQGVVGTVDETERIRTALAGIECFQNLQHSGATTPAADGRRQYRLEADVRCPNEVRGSDTGRRRRRSSGGGAAATKQGGS
jgi:type II secretory pathway component PulL